MNKWECIQVNHHKDIGETIEEYQRKGWALHTYQAAGVEGMSGSVKHYLLFGKEVLVAPANQFHVGNYNCPSCNSIVSPSAKTCPKCGKNLDPMLDK
jgi:tRNA(Leu) C34 or U34 (ribose-2'-O)-methylase TrmL